MWPEEKNPEVWKMESNFAVALILLAILSFLSFFGFLIYWGLS